MSGPRKTRTPYTQDDDAFLMKYIAIYNPDGANRLGNALYSRLVENAEGKWPWSKRHSWQSWRERYKDHQHRFDANIKKYQKRKGIKVPEKYSKISFSELERRAKLEAFASSPNGGNAAADPDFSSPEPPTLRRIKRVSATQPQTREERHENEGPRPEHAQPSTQGHKMLASRPARKTAIVAAYSEPEEGEIISQEEGEIGSDGEHRKRKAEEVKVTSGSKRQRMHSDASVPGPPMNGHLPVDKGISIKPPSQNGYVGNEYSSPPKPTSSKISRLESLSPFSKNDNVLDNKQTLALLLETLRSQPEGQKEAIEFIKNRLSQAGPSTNGQANTDDQGRLYPRLEKEDYDITGPRTAGGGILGSWNGAEGPVTSTPANPLRQTNGASSSALVEKEASVTPKAKDDRGTSASNGSLAKTRQLASYNKSAEDFFETPTPTPKRADAAQLGTPSPLAPKVHDHGENKENNPEQENLSSPSKHDSPQHRNITPTSPFVPSFRRPAKPRRKAPDMDSGSETEVVLEEHPVRNMNSSQSAKESWPPLRKEKSSEVKVSPPRADNAIQNVVANLTEKSTKGAPIAEIVGSTLAGTPKVPSQARDQKIPRDATSTSGDKPQRATNSTKVQDEKTASDKIQATQESLNVRPLQAASEASPLRARVSILRPTSSERINRTEVHAWRSEAPVANIRSASTSIATESDPFLTKDHAMRLRRVEKGKEKEVAASAMGMTASEAKARADRRKTFAGFPTLKPPEIDLRKRALRTSVAGNASNVALRLSFSPSVAPRNDEEQDDREENRIRRRASVTATIDLSQEFPSPGVSIPPTDHAFIMRAGVQVLLQSIARNHSVSEDFVRGIYEELLDLQATDRVVSKMRQVAEHAVEKELEREKRKKRNSDVASVPISSVPSAGHKADLGPSSVQSSPERREVDFSTLSEPARGRSVSGPRRSELLITPADEDPTFVRLRNQYVPPSTSRAARFVRHRARRSSGLGNSPLNGYGNDEEDMQADDYEDDEKEEEEVFMALTPGRMLGDTLDSFASGQAELGDASQNASSTAGPSNKAREADTSFVQPWTAEEDEILLDGEDEEAIKAIEERRGKRAVKWRLAELSAGDILS